VRAAIAGDFAVDKKHRAYGPALPLQKAVQARVEDDDIAFILGLPNKLSEAVFLRIGYAEIGTIERYVKIMRTEHKLEKHIKPQAIVKISSKILDFGMEKLSKEATYKHSSSCSIETPNLFDKRFDDLWKNGAKQFEIIEERISNFLNWRYVQFPMRRYHIFSLVNAEQAIVGYVVYHIENSVCYIVDMMFVGPAFLDALLYEFIRFGRDKGMISISISYMGSESTIDKLKHWGFRPRQSSSKVVLYCKKDFPSSQILMDKNKWHLLEGDGDV
jgi:hypothetical protein